MRVHSESSLICVFGLCLPHQSCLPLFGCTDGPEPEDRAGGGGVIWFTECINMWAVAP